MFSLIRPMVFGAAFAGFTLLFVLAMLPSAYFLDPEVLRAFPIVGTPWFTVLCCLIVVVTGLFGLALSRFAMRLIPIRFPLRVRVRAFVVGLFFLVLLVLFALVAVYSPIVDDRSNAGVGVWFDSAAPEAVRVAGAIAVLVFAVCTAIPFLWRHARPGAFLKQPFILYLRRFSTFSDRSVMNEVLRACPHGKPLVFLTPTRSAIRDWNPFQIGLAGMRVRNPIRSLPIPVRTENASWQNSARELIEAAEVIVLDASEGSVSILTETQLIDSMHMWHKTVVLRTVADQPIDGAKNELLAGRSAEVIRYERNWRRALPRLILGPVISIFPAMWLAVFLLVITMLFLSLFTIAGADFQGGFQQLLSQETGTRVALGLTAIFALWIYIVLFWRPSINKEAAVALATRLQGAQRTASL
jgi:hypothetical protein